MGGVGAKRRLRQVIFGLVTTLIMMSAVVAQAPPASAAAGDLAYGVVTADANKNGQVDTGLKAGLNDEPVAGVKVTLLDANGVAAATTTTDGDGAWRFAAASINATANPGPYRVQIDTSNPGIYAVYSTATAGVNDFVRSGSAATAIAGPVNAAAAPVELNALVWPVWKFNLALAGDPDGLGGLSVYTGTAPFDSADTEDGWDSGPANSRVRTSDTVNYNWSVTLASQEALATKTASAVFEQTLTLTDGAMVNFNRIPARCSGTSPASSIIAYPSGTSLSGREVPPAGTTSVVLTCNLGAVGQDVSAIILPTSVFVSNSSPNGSSYSTEARVYAVDSAGTATAQPDGGVKNGPVDITAAPRFDVEKNLGGAGTGSFLTPSGERLAGTYIYYNVQIAADRQTGVEAFKLPITLTEDFYGLYTDTAGVNGTPGTPITDLEFYMDLCTQSSLSDGTNHGTAVYGKIGLNGGEATSKNSVVDSGTCTFQRDAADATSGYKITLSGVDLSGKSYPTVTKNGSPVPSDKFYVASYRLRFWVPNRAVDAAVGSSNDSVGELAAYNGVGDFDPVGISGASNYGTGFEPGYCQTVGDGGEYDQMDCDAMEDARRSNNVAGPVTVRIAAGAFSKSVGKQTDSWNPNNLSMLPEQYSWHNGTTQMQPGQSGTIRVNLDNQSNNTWNDVAMYDVFDNTTAKLIPLSQTDGLVGQADIPSDMYSYVLNPYTDVDVATQQAWNDKFTIYYAHTDLQGDIANNGTFDLVSDRYAGIWDAQRAYRPDITDLSEAAGWYTDPTAVPGGIDQVNVVLAVLKDGETMPPGNYNMFYVGLEQRDTYYNPAVNGNTAGPVDGDSIPTGTVVADFAGIRTDVYSPNWTGRSYIAQPENGSTDGDRWTVTRAQMALQKRSIKVDGVGTGAADFGATGAAIAGKQVVWEVVSSLTAASEDPAAVENVVITDTLPKYVTYNESCTAELTGGTVATTVTPNSDGTTTLTWSLGTLIPNQAIAPRIICTDTDPLAPNNTGLVNYAIITADGIPTVNSHDDEHTVVLEQTGELQLKKSVDHPLDVQDDSQTYTLQVKNFSETLKVQAPTVYEVLPFNGDGTNAASVDRSPASDYDGVSALTGPPSAYDLGKEASLAGTFYYTTIDSSSVPVAKDLDTDPSIWVTQDAVTDWAAVKGFKFVADSALGVTTSGDKSGLTIVFSTKQSDNSAGDLYSNRFVVASDTFKNGSSYQLLTSNLVTVRVVGFSLGDLVWFEQDDVAGFDPTKDAVAPEGVKVNVYDAAANTLIGSTTTNKDGRWVINNLKAGSYYAEIPESEFADGGLLHNYVPTTVGYQADPDTDKNESVDHHAEQVSTDAGYYVRTQPINLGYELDADSQPIGLEPLGDNVAGLHLAPLTTDDFSNLTLDMALEYPNVDFTVTKKVTGDAASFAAASYDMTVTCTLNGTTVDGYPQDITVNANDNVTLSAPVASVCTVEETNAHGATTVTVSAPDGITLVSDATANDLTVANDYPDGSFAINKKLAGPGASIVDPADAYTFAVVCTFDGREIYNESVEVTAGNLVSDEVGPLPVGANCSVTETDAGSADAVAAVANITITEKDQTITPVEVTNRFSAGSIALTKSVEAGDFQDFFEGLTYQAHVMCELESATVYDGTVNVVPGTTTTATDANGDEVLVPVGSLCYIESETVTQGAKTTTVTPSSPDEATAVVVSDSDDPQVLEMSMTNAFDMAEFTVSKSTIGDAPVDGEYEFAVSCTYPVTNDQGQVVPTALDLGDDASFKLKADESRTIKVPAGASCSAEEVDSLDATSTTIVDSSTVDGSSTTDGVLETLTGTDSTIAFTNEFPVEVTVTKKIDGDAASFATGPYTLNVICRLGDQTVLDKTVTLDADQSETLKGLPFGSVCNVTEVDLKGATRGSNDAPDGAKLAAGGNEIVVTNTFAAGYLQIMKQVEGVGKTLSKGSFTFDVACDFNGKEDVFTKEVKLDDDGSGTLSSDVLGPLPVGAVCTVTESDNGGADETAAPVELTITEEAQDAPQIAGFLNEFSAGELSLTKTVEASEDYADFFNGLSYELLVTCQADLDGTIVDLYSGLQTVTPGQTTQVEVDGEPLLLPIGAHCYAEESQAQGATGIAVSNDSYENAIVVNSGSPEELQMFTINATNTFADGQIEISKEVVGGGSAGPYTFGLSCTYPVTNGDGVVEDKELALPGSDASFELSAGETKTVSVPQGATCAVTESNIPEAAVATIVDTDETSDGGNIDGVVKVTDEVSKVIITNSFRNVLPATDSLAGVLWLGGFGLLLTGALLYGARARRATKA